jgi:predicted transcriptional regulator
MMQEQIIIGAIDMLKSLQKLGFTEEGIASAADISQSTVSRLLSGKIQQARFDVALKIYSVYLKYCRK